MKNSAERIVGFLVVTQVLVSAFAYGHSVEAQTTMKIDRNKPSVYVAFVNFEPREPLRTGEGGRGVRLKLSNNIRHSIRVCTLYSKDRILLAFPRAGAEERIAYSVERVANHVGFDDSKKPELSETASPPPVIQQAASAT